MNYVIILTILAISRIYKLTEKKNELISILIDDINSK